MIQYLYRASQAVSSIIQYRCLLRRKIYFTVTNNPSGKTNIINRQGRCYVYVGIIQYRYNAIILIRVLTT
jgi:hypothetical protein